MVIDKEMIIDETNLNAAIYALAVIQDAVEAHTRGVDIPHLHVEFATVFGFLAELDEQASYND